LSLHRGKRDNVSYKEAQQKDCVRRSVCRKVEKRRAENEKRTGNKVAAMPKQQKSREIEAVGTTTIGTGKKHSTRTNQTKKKGFLQNLTGLKKGGIYR